MTKINTLENTFKTENGRATLTIKRADGYHSASCEFPFYTEVINETTQKPELKKQTKKQIKAYLLNIVMGQEA